jgi:ketosteroid isomerase-like protein
LRRRVLLTLPLALTVARAAAADDADRELLDLVRRILRAWESLDIARVDPYYATDGDLTFFDLAPLKYANWAEYRTGVQKLFFEPNRSLTFTINDDLRVHRRGSLAWVTFTFGADVVSKQNVKSRLIGRWTLVLERHRDGWRVVHEHVSVPLGS